MKKPNLTSDSYNQELFNHMQNEHDLILLHSEMLEIELICNKEIKSQLKESDEKQLTEFYYWSEKNIKTNDIVPWKVNEYLTSNPK